MSDYDYTNSYRNWVEKSRQLIINKNRDYSGGNPYWNFTRVEHILEQISYRVGFATRISDKIGRIVNLISNPNNRKVKTESINDTLEDLANYFILWYVIDNTDLEYNQKEENRILFYSDVIQICDEISKVSVLNRDTIFDNFTIQVSNPKRQGKTVPQMDSHKIDVEFTKQLKECFETPFNKDQLHYVVELIFHISKIVSNLNGKKSWGFYD